MALFERHLDNLIETRVCAFDSLHYVPAAEWRDRRGEFLGRAKDGSLGNAIFKNARSYSGGPGHSGEHGDDDYNDEEVEQFVAILLGVIAVIIIGWRGHSASRS